MARLSLCPIITMVHTILLMANNGVSDGGGNIYIYVHVERKRTGGGYGSWLIMVCLRSSKLLTYSSQDTHVTQNLSI